eukprot:jgi/Botrbrau1/2319/Bobra.39_1s0008.1
MDRVLESQHFSYQHNAHRLLIPRSQFLYSSHVYYFLRSRWISRQGQDAHQRLLAVAKALADAPPLSGLRRVPWASKDLDSEEKRSRSGRWTLLPPGLRQARSDEPWVSALCDAFHTKSLNDVKALLDSLLLCEGTYKVIDHGPEGARRIMAETVATLPEALVTIRQMQWTREHVQHRYLLAEGEGRMYVAFMGTKQRRDLVTNANILQEPVWPELVESVDDDDFRINEENVPAAHRGFLSRARAIPIEALYRHACQHGKELILTGHSLGGAVAVLCMLRLLGELPPNSQPSVRCLTFACPAIGNAALAELVKARGWEKFFTNLLVPEDVIPRLLGSPAAAVPSTSIGLLQPTSSPAVSEETTQRLFDYFAENPGALALSPVDSSMSMDSMSSLDNIDWEGMDGEGDMPAGVTNSASLEPGPPALRARQLITFIRRQAEALRARSRAPPAQRAERGSAAPRGAGQLLPRAPPVPDAVIPAAAAYAVAEAATEGMVEGVPPPQDGTPGPVPVPKGVHAENGKGADVLNGTVAEAGDEGPSSPAAVLAQRYSSDAREQSDLRSGEQPAQPRRRISVAPQWVLNKALGTVSTVAGAGMRIMASPLRAGAHIVGGPYRAVQRSFFSLGPQLYIFPHAVTDTMPEEGEESMVEDEEKNGEGPVGPISTIVSNSLPEVASRRRQPFLMHKMAFHRARLSSILYRIVPKSLAERPGRPASFVLSHRIGPYLRPTRAEVFEPYKLPGWKDVEAVYDDLASLSQAPEEGGAQVQGPGKQRWQWLRLWALVSGFGWKGSGGPREVQLTVIIRGSGLEHCTGVSVQALADPDAGYARRVVCRTELVAKPRIPPLGRTYSELDAGAHPWVRTFMLWVAVALMNLKRVLGVIDRTNTTRIDDSIEAKVWVPLDLMQRMQERVVDRSGPQHAGLLVTLLSDFHEVRLPLQLHAGASWLLSDAVRTARAFLRWLQRFSLSWKQADQAGYTAPTGKRPAAASDT